MELTKIQVELMEHTISQGRNWFGTSLNCRDSNEFVKLIEMGLAKSSQPANWMGDEILYHVTPKGRNAILAWYKIPEQEKANGA